MNHPETNNINTKKQTKEVSRREFLKRTAAGSAKLAGAAGVIMSAGLANSSCQSRTTRAGRNIATKTTGSTGQGNVAGSNKRLNILAIFADQMHGFAMGCMGHPDIKTPTLDKLAAEGTLFRNMYSNCPLCTPFRCALLTSRYGSQTGVLQNNKPVPAGERTLAAAFNDAGYITSYVGKWHLGNSGNKPIIPKDRADFRQFIGYYCYNDFLHNVYFYDEKGREHRSNKHRIVATTDIALERLKQIKNNNFLMFVSYQSPHYPEQPGPAYKQMYQDLKPKRRPNCTKNPDFDPYTPTWSPHSPRPKQKDPVYQDYGDNLDEYLREYYAMITQMDDNIGRLLRALDTWGLSDNTVVMFFSDHGDMQGSHGLKNKRVAWEESSRVPLIIRAPGAPKGQVTDHLASGIDIFPTCLGFASLPDEPTTEGQDLSPIVFDKTKLSDKPIFSEMDRWAMVRNGKYKLVVRTPRLKPTHLFDLIDDPYEMTNLIKDVRYDTVKSKLYKQIQSWHKKVTV